jgi:acetate kinase
MESILQAAPSTVLSINVGSSSIKFALYESLTPNARLFEGEIANVGGSDSAFRVADGPTSFERDFPIPDHVTAAMVLVDWLHERLPAAGLIAIGHRVVYSSAEFRATQRVTPALLESMFLNRSYDSEHLPQEKLLIETLSREFPGAIQVACFDSNFHVDMPQVASMLPIPRHFFASGVVRQGFHGLSCTYAMRELAASAGAVAAKAKVVLAHLGGGCSVTAVKGGQSIDTSMGLTPAGGMVMATRCGDVDPGLGWRLLREHDVSPVQFNHMINQDSGLKGISGISGDLRHLLSCEASERGAAEAVEMFCYQARKQIGAMASALEGLDTLVFMGGIGENLPVVRARICAALAFVGIQIDDALNNANASLISTKGSAVAVRIVATDEQMIIAEETCKFVSAAALGVSSEAGHG